MVQAFVPVSYTSLSCSKLPNSRLPLAIPTNEKCSMWLRTVVKAIIY